MTFDNLNVSFLKMEKSTVGKIGLPKVEKNSSH